MSNVLAHSIDMKSTKNKLLDMIASGYIESKALADIGLPRSLFIRWCVEDPEFVKQVEEARTARAEFWVAKLAENIDEIYPPSEVPGHKLRMDKLVFLAKADNPERYGNNSKTKVDISLDLKQFKLLPPDEAVKALANDPFAIVEADFTPIKEEELL